ncbi:hypothetical protein C8T65DRAFT_570710 [Cerioporus squamosus]|nr:hypothetical protein C8T65DRAFT_570710 [Cerioporus squamosus]
MHPGYKLNHFRKVGWPEDWIAVAETMIRDEWETYYKPQAAPAPPIVDPNMRQMFSTAISPDSTHASGTADPLDAYLKSLVVPNVSDPLEYWNTRLASPSDTLLARFALDFLSVPGKYPYSLLYHITH